MARLAGRIAALDKSWLVREGAASILANCALAADLPALLQLARDYDRLVRSEAALAIGKRRLKAGHRVIVELLDDPDPAVRKLAAIGLAYFGRDEDAALIESKLALEDNPFVAIGQIDALLSLGKGHHALRLTKYVTKSELRRKPSATESALLVLSDHVPSLGEETKVALRRWLLRSNRPWLSTQPLSGTYSHISGELAR